MLSRVDSMEGKSVSYCCIWKGGRVLYSYSIGNHEMDSLAALCLEMIPPYHRWYFETLGNNTFSFFMEDDGLVYFAIVCKRLGKPQALSFLHKLRDEFGRRRGSTAGFSIPPHPPLWPAQSHTNAHLPSSSTEAPLLGKPTKHEKRKMKDHTVAIEMMEEEEERRRSTDRIDSGPSSDPNNDQGTKDFTSSRKWCRQVRIILAVDAAVCLVLFIIWLAICGGIECIR